MPKKANSIPVNRMIDDPDTGISIERLFLTDKLIASAFEEAKQSHRHDNHSFYLLEKGTVTIEIDFRKYRMKPLSVIYIHPSQVHRTTAFKNVTVSCLAINNENLDADYLKWLEDITPAKPLVLKKEAFSILSEAATFCLKLSELKTNRLHHSLLQNSCNALVALVLSQYLAVTKTKENPSRFEAVTKDFKKLLEHNYTVTKRPAEYAQKLNISIPYLNECVKAVTGFSVSHHIQQRVVLEAKRLLYHSDKSVKEIAVALGYDDYPYFSRLFTKVTGTPALVFRNKNRD